MPLTLREKTSLGVLNCAAEGFLPDEEDPLETGAGSSAIIARRDRGSEEDEEEEDEEEEDEDEDEEEGKEDEEEAEEMLCELSAIIAKNVPSRGG